MLDQIAKIRSMSTVVTLVEQIIVSAIEIASSLVLFASAVTADGTTTIVQVLTLVLETFKSGTNLIQVFNINV